jgi:hypothetical protein
MVYISNKNIISQFSLVYSLIGLFFFINKINCSSLNSTEIEQFNKTMNRYKQMVANYNILSKKMEKITLNIFMRIRFKDLKRSFDDLKSEIDALKLKYHKKESISENIIIANNLTDDFEIKYINSVNAYKRFEETKNMLGGMLKTFIIVLSIFIFIVLLFIGIGSYFVIQYNKKKRYFKLNEEVSIRIGQSDEKVKDKSNQDNKNDFMGKSTEEDIQGRNDINKNQVQLQSHNSPLSKEYLSQNNI